MRDNTTAANNTAVGTYALDVNTTGTQNTAVGTNTLDPVIQLLVIIRQWVMLR